MYHFTQFWCFFIHNFKVSYLPLIFKILLKCLVFRSYFAFNLLIYPRQISVINCNDHTSNKVWKNIEVCHSVYLPVFQHLHWKTIYSNHSRYKPFGLSLHWHFCNPKQVLVRWGIICWSNLAYVIWWWQFWQSDALILLFITRLGWSVKMRSMQDEEFWRMCVGSDISWEKPYSELIDWICVPSLFVMLWTHQLLDLALKSPSRIVKAGSPQVVNIKTKFSTKRPI